MHMLIYMAIYIPTENVCIQLQDRYGYTNIDWYVEMYVPVVLFNYPIAILMINTSNCYFKRIYYTLILLIHFEQNNNLIMNE